jgi:hypothetical protein
MPTDDDVRTHNYLAASADLLAEAFQVARAEDPEGAAGLSRMLRAGGLITLRTTFGHAAGLVQISIDIVEPNGEAHTLMSTELTRVPLQRS